MDFNFLFRYFYLLGCLLTWLTIFCKVSLDLKVILNIPLKIIISLMVACERKNNFCQVDFSDV